MVVILIGLIEGVVGLMSIGVVLLWSFVRFIWDDLCMWLILISIIRLVFGMFLM